MNINTIRAGIFLVILAFMVTPVAASVYYTSSTPQIITKGDSFTISGTGAKNGIITLWIIGRNYFDTLAVTPDRFGNFTLSIKPSTTEKFSSGQYAVVLQDPGAGGMVEIEPGTDSNGNLTIMNRGKIIERIGARQDLKANVRPVVAVLTAAANNRDVDDTFLPEYFFVEEPSVQFDNLLSPPAIRLSDKITGERITITGTTNMGSENYLRAHIYNKKTNALITSNTLPVVAGSSINRWTYDLNTPGLPSGDYYMTVGWSKTNQTGTGMATFAVKNPTNSTPSPPPYAGIEKSLTPDDLSTLLFLTISGVLIVILIIFAVGKK